MKAHTYIRTGKVKNLRSAQNLQVVGVVSESKVVLGGDFLCGVKTELITGKPSEMSVNIGAKNRLKKNTGLSMDCE